LTYEQFCDTPNYTNLSKKQKARFDELTQVLIKAGQPQENAIEIAYTQCKKIITKKSKTIPVIKSANDEKMIAIEVIYEPFVPDLHGQWASADTLRKACADFNEKLKEGVVSTNLFHSFDTDTFEITKSWINEVVCDIGDFRVPEGTWLCEIQYKSPELWEMRKSGEIGGVSICANGGVLVEVEENSIEEE